MGRPGTYSLLSQPLAYYLPRHPAPNPNLSTHTCTRRTSSAADAPDIGALRTARQSSTTTSPAADAPQRSHRHGPASRHAEGPVALRVLAGPCNHGTCPAEVGGAGCCQEAGQDPLPRNRPYPWSAQVPRKHRTRMCPCLYTCPCREWSNRESQVVSPLLSDTDPAGGLTYYRILAAPCSLWDLSSTRIKPRAVKAHILTTTPPV